MKKRKYIYSKYFFPLPLSGSIFFGTNLLFAKQPEMHVLKTVT